MPLVPKHGTERRSAMGVLNVTRAKKRYSKEHRQMWGSLGGIASGKARRIKMTFREAMTAVCEVAATAEELEQVGFPPEQAKQYEGKIPNLLVATMAIMSKARDGNLQAWEAMRDTMGEAPVVKTENTNVGPPPSLTVRFASNEEEK